MSSALAVVIIVAAVGVAVACEPVGTSAAGATSSIVPAPDPSNATFKIESDTVTLVGGRAERDAAPGSATKVTTTLSDLRGTGDVDGDGRADTVVVLVYQPGGSGTFFYVAALLNGTSGVTATPAVLLGDRVKISGVKVDGRAITVDMLDRSAGQPLSASPSVASTRHYVVDRGALIAQ